MGMELQPTPSRPHPMFASLCVYHVLLEGLYVLLDDIPSIHMDTQSHKHWMWPDRAVGTKGAT